MLLFPRKRREKRLKSTKVKALKQIQQVWKILMILTTSIFVKPLTVWMTTNDSLRNIG